MRHAATITAWTRSCAGCALLGLTLSSAAGDVPMSVDREAQPGAATPLVRAAGNEITLGYPGVWRQSAVVPRDHYDTKRPAHLDARRPHPAAGICGAMCVTVDVGHLFGRPRLRYSFTGSLVDAAGFYYGSELGVLLVEEQRRREEMPYATHYPLFSIGFWYQF